MKNWTTIIIMLIISAVSAFSQEHSVSTNIVDLAMGGTMNIDGSIAVQRHWTLDAGIKYNPFSYGNQESEKFSKQRCLTVGSRWWPWHIYSGWWLNGMARWQEFSMTTGTDTQTREGDRFGAGMGAGYSKMITRHLNLDFGVSMWIGHSIYRTYACQHCGRILEKGEGLFILPADILMSISYVF